MAQAFMIFIFNAKKSPKYYKRGLYDLMHSKPLIAEFFSFRKNLFMKSVQQPENFSAQLCFPF